MEGHLAGISQPDVPAAAQLEQTLWHWTTTSGPICIGHLTPTCSHALGRSNARKVRLADGLLDKRLAAVDDNADPLISSFRIFPQLSTRGRCPSPA